MKRNGFALIIVFVLLSTVLAIAGLALYQTSLCRSLARLQYIHYQQHYALIGLRSYALDFTRRRWHAITTAQELTSREMANWCSINDEGYTARIIWQKTTPGHLRIAVRLFGAQAALETSAVMFKKDKTYMARLAPTSL